MKYKFILLVYTQVFISIKQVDPYFLFLSKD
jgi:hypothetical protein